MTDQRIKEILDQKGIKHFPDRDDALSALQQLRDEMVKEMEVLNDYRKHLINLDGERIKEIERLKGLIAELLDVSKGIASCKKCIEASSKFKQQNNL